MCDLGDEFRRLECFKEDLLDDEADDDDESNVVMKAPTKSNTAAPDAMDLKPLVFVEDTGDDDDLGRSARSSSSCVPTDKAPPLRRCNMIVP